MSTDGKKGLGLSKQAQEKIQQCVQTCIESEFGSEGPPKETTFAKMEIFGHQVGQLIAQKLDEQLAQQHSKQHYQQTALCPCCQSEAPQKEDMFERDFKTVDGDVPLKEPAYHCPVCNRDFFPSAVGFAD